MSPVCPALFSVSFSPHTLRSVFVTALCNRQHNLCIRIASGKCKDIQNVKKKLPTCYEEAHFVLRSQQASEGHLAVSSFV